MMVDRALVAGVDEAGRGCLAGPVVAAACVLPNDAAYDAISPAPRIADSKILMPEEREAAYTWITAHCAYGIGSADAAMIDRSGILTATERAMQDAVAVLAKTVTPIALLVDGRDYFWFDYPVIRIVRGDQSERCIAAASILAKVTRDRMMVAHAADFSAFGFDAHKGYGTPEHRSAIARFGPCPLHRRTFLRNIPLSTSLSPGKRTMLVTASASEVDAAPHTDTTERHPRRISGS